jgi:UDP-2,3-diacylglucosamine hydrolase
MPVAIIADAHVGGPGGAVEPLLAQLVEVAAQRPERLVLLGDLFQVWVGFPQYETSEIRRFLETVGVVRAAGVPVHYIEGNRDFFLAAGSARDAFDSIGTELAFESGGVQWLAVHGDGLNDRDRQYLAWRWLSKSALSRSVIRHLPARVVGRFVASTERKLTGTNFKHKIRVPEEAIRRYGERRLAGGHDVLLLGHFHQARTWRVAGGEIRLLEAWFSSRRVEWVGGPAPPR